MTTEVSRRSILARGAMGAAAAALPVTSGALAAEDPIYALIAEHRRAAAAWSEAADTMHECEDYDPPTGLSIGERPGMAFRDVSINGRDYLSYEPTGTMVPIIARNRMDIEANVPRDLSPAEAGAWLDGKFAEWHLHAEAEIAANQATPRYRAWKLYNELGDVLDGLTEQLVTARPTTVAGVAAALERWAEFADEIEDFSFEDACLYRVNEFIANISDALMKIAAV
jgi:hypothetical protein